MTAAQRLAEALTADPLLRELFAKAEAEIMQRGEKAIVLQVNGKRFFTHWGAKQQMQTAWSIAGATMYLDSDTGAIEKAEAKLRAAGHRVARRTVVLLPVAQ